MSDIDNLQQTLWTIVQEVSRLTELPSRWNGHVAVATDLEIDGSPAFYAKKSWSCGVLVHTDRMHNADVIESLIHEAFHSVSPGLNPTAFRNWRGWEEGV